jgi:DNA-directed RNA polymerase specialized sigma24 family protein
MQYLNTSYSVYSNKRHERVGHFLQGRYKAFLIEKDPYLLAVSRYLHLNPVRANLAAKPEDYAWSSYQDYIGKNTRFEYLTSRMVLNQFSPDLLHAKRRYREFVEEGMQKAENPFASLKADLILGSDEFVEKLRQKLLVKKDLDVPQTRYFSTAVSFEEVLKIVSAHFGIAEREIEQADKRNNRARRACLYLLRKCTDLPSGQIAQRFQITYTAVTKACSRFEQEMKQDKELSFLVNECMRTLTGGPDSEI